MRRLKIGIALIERMTSAIIGKGDDIVRPISIP